MMLRAVVLFITTMRCRDMNSYIVMFDRDPHVNRVYANALHSLNVAETQRMLQPDENIGIRTSTGYIANMSEETAEKIRRHPSVRVVERDMPVYVSGLMAMDVPDRIQTDEIVIQKDAPWGLAHVSGNVSLAHRSYRYPSHSGKGVDIYVLDTGVEVEHPEFEGRARWGANFVSGSPDKDEHGHGTHCAGVAGGKNFGITKKSNIVAVKVLDKHGSGMISRLLEGIDFVIGEHEKKKEELYDKNAARYLGADEDSTTLLEMDIESTDDLSVLQTPMGRGRPSSVVDLVAREIPQPKSVVNLSVGGFRSTALNFAVEYASKLGIHFSTAAGNEHEDACDFSPSSSKAGIVSGASTYRDTVAFFSNFGSCVDVFAPGVDILSSWIGGTQKLASGTSMATPHTTGVMAAYLTYYDYRPDGLKSRILKDAYNIIRNDIYGKDTDLLSGMWHLPSFFGNSGRKLPMLSIENLLRKVRK